MRKVLYTSVGAIAVVVATASIAAAASPALCGTRYTPRCTSPFISHIPVSVACHAPASVIRLASFTASANAGIKKITVTVHSKAKTVYSASGNGAKKKTVSGVTINTAGLNAGAHTITIKVVDQRGKTTTTTYHFAICKPKPIFTG
ncbi:MAG: hypothetical protein QOJ25_2087 [Solirubrobacteraceae bacterium]|jgi:hypothetical protein|nr:hypothetical protein [Solirubrobacteraceae bacterium]